MIESAENSRSRTETVHIESWELFQTYVESFEDPGRKLWDDKRLGSGSGPGNDKRRN